MTRTQAPRVAGIVLAAGESSLMGKNKLLLEVEGESLLHRTVSRALDAGLDPVVVVLGYDAERTRQGIEDLDCETVVNEDYRDGIGSSLRTGIEAVAGRAAGAVTLLADMPYVGSDMIAKLVDTYKESGAPLVLSEYEGVTAPPILYDRSLFEELTEAPADGHKRVVKRNRSSAVEVAWSARALADVDEPADFEQLEKRLQEARS